MSIMGRSFRSSQIVRIDSRILAKLALDAYDECWLDYCCDPTEMAERLGFIVEMTEGRGEIIGGILLCPALSSRREAGEVVYRLIAGVLLHRSRRTFARAAAIDAIASELMLPHCVATQVENTELPVVQRYVPLDSLQRIYREHRGSQRVEPAVTGRKLDRVTV